MLKQILFGAAAVAAAAAPCAVASADSGKHLGAGAAFTYAIYGDAPYGKSPTDTSETDATPAFIDAVNADPDVSSVVHVGDIHSGSQYCTAAYDEQVYGLWTKFADPLVYTPGDNEWADCHKKKEGGGVYDATTGTIKYVLGTDGLPVNYANGNPVANLDLVRSIFFATAGQTLGGGGLAVTSQATAYDPAHPEDAQYVENVRWERHGIVFVTVDVPGGSNNDADPWYGTPMATDEQTQERTARTVADLRWLDASFDYADRAGAAGIVLLTQADMWDLDGAATNAHLSNYESLIANIAGNTKAFRHPVLLLNGDSHIYRSDNPLQQASACVGDSGVCAYDAWTSHPSYDVSNFHRIVVHGSTVPLEYLKLTIDPSAHNATTATSFGNFSWKRITE
jgi:hypothetical protein